MALAERGMAVLWRALCSVYADIVLGAVWAGLAAVWVLLSFVREPLAGADLHALAQAVWLARVGRVMAVLVGGVALLRLIGFLIPWWVPPPRRSPNPGLLRIAHPPSDAEWRQAGLSVIKALPTPGGTLMVARPHARVWQGGMLLPVGLVLLIGAFGVQAAFGGHSAILPLLLGHRLPLALPGGFEVGLEEIRVMPKGTSLAWVEADITLWEGETPLGSRTIREWRSRRVEHLTFYLRGYGPAARLSAFQQGAGDREEVLPLLPLSNGGGYQQVVRVGFAEEEEQQIALPAQNLIVRLVHYPPEPNVPDQGAFLHVQALSGRDGQVLAEGFVRQSPLCLAVGPVRLMVAPEYYVLLGAERRVAQPLFALGLFAGALGVLARFLWPPHLVWLGLRQEGDAWLGDLRASDPALEAKALQAVMSEAEKDCA